MRRGIRTCFKIIRRLEVIRPNAGDCLNTKEAERVDCSVGDRAALTLTSCQIDVPLTSSFVDLSSPVLSQAPD